jgi:hypothetical protein
LLCGESMPVIVSIVAHVGVEGFPTVVVRHIYWSPLYFLSAAGYCLICSGGAEDQAFA